MFSTRISLEIITSIFQAQFALFSLFFIRFFLIYQVQTRSMQSSSIFLYYHS
jgi:hypothetical protein